MSGIIYLIQDGDRLIRMEQTDYAREEDFQQLLQEFPELLAGEQIDGGDPRRWLFVAREAGIPSEVEGTNRWALDHLFLDQDAIPTLVEVKRKSDTRLRREVVGQMLDYAANAVIYWPGDELRRLYLETCERLGRDADRTLLDFLQGHEDQDAFWEQAKANLREGRVRLVFVADRIPTELQRIIEFLNERMRPTEVLGVEIRRYTGEGFSTHIPRVIGQTGEAQLNNVPRAHSSSARRRWDEAGFFEEVEKRLGSGRAEVVRDLYRFSKETARVTWGTNLSGSFSVKFDHVHPSKSLYSVYSNGDVELNFAWLGHDENSAAVAEKFGQGLKDVPGFDIPDNFRERYVRVPFENWAGQLETFIGVVKMVTQP